MVNLDQLEEEVANLVRDESSPFEFRDVFKKLQDAGKVASEGEVERLGDIVGAFRPKIPNLIILKPIKAAAKDLQTT